MEKNNLLIVSVLLLPRSLLLPVTQPPGEAPPLA
jgi:hypothetical protein